MCVSCRASSDCPNRVQECTRPHGANAGSTNCTRGIGTMAHHSRRAHYRADIVSSRGFGVGVSEDALLGLGVEATQCEFAEWYCVPHEAAVRPDGEPFSTRTGGDGRRVVLSVPSGPNAMVFPRTTRTESYQGHPHDPHDSRCDGDPCKITRHGHVLVNLPLRVNARDLDNYYSCMEPNGPLLNFLRQGRRL